ncbi:thymidylate kinase [Bacillus phage vB_BanS-Thrax5]|nr:thymidylate kinase [Bacillus phage vB_BanS-Thrax5]
MAHITIIEGTRGSGKSTVARKMRDKISEMTLINFTGFHDDGYEGMKKVYRYYINWISTLHGFCKEDIKIICDRFFFSEQVYSQLYKDYDFTDRYNFLAKELFVLSQIGLDVDIVFLKVEEEEILQQRLMRDKVAFAEVAENAKESLRQQEGYEKVFNDFYMKHVGNGTIRLHTIITDNLSPEEVEAKVANIIKTAQ